MSALSARRTRSSLWQSLRKQPRKKSRCGNSSFSSGCSSLRALSVVPLDDDATVLLSAKRCAVIPNRLVFTCARNSDSIGAYSLAHEVVADRPRPVEAEHDVG